jgi:hypothetical protein
LDHIHPPQEKVPRLEVHQFGPKTVGEAIPRRRLVLVDWVVDAGNSNGDTMHTRKLFCVQVQDGEDTLLPVVQQFKVVQLDPGVNN